MLFLYIFFFNDTATTEIYPLSLHDALPISGGAAYVQDLRLPGMLHARVIRPPSYDARLVVVDSAAVERMPGVVKVVREDRKSTRLNSSHVRISYAVFCLKKKKAH